MFKLTYGRKVIEDEERVIYGIRYNEEYYIDDVSSDREFTEKLVEMFNSFDLSPYHLYDVVEDMLG